MTIRLQKVVVGLPTDSRRRVVVYVRSHEQQKCHPRVDVCVED